MVDARYAQCENDVARLLASERTGDRAVPPSSSTILYNDLMPSQTCLLNSLIRSRPDQIRVVVEFLREKTMNVLWPMGSGKTQDIVLASQCWLQNRIAQYYRGLRTQRNLMGIPWTSNDGLPRDTFEQDGVRVVVIVPKSLHTNTLDALIKYNPNVDLRRYRFYTKEALGHEHIYKQIRKEVANNFLIVDEAHLILKTKTGKTTGRRVKRLMDLVESVDPETGQTIRPEAVLIVTGTPGVDSFNDVYNLAHLNARRHSGKVEREFLRLFPSQATFYQPDHPWSNEQKRLLEEIFMCRVSVLEQDETALGYPALNITNVIIAMTDQAQKDYESIEGNVAFYHIERQVSTGRTYSSRKSGDLGAAEDKDEEKDLSALEEFSLGPKLDYLRHLVLDSKDRGERLKGRRFPMVIYTPYVDAGVVPIQSLIQSLNQTRTKAVPPRDPIRYDAILRSQTKEARAERLCWFNKSLLDDIILTPAAAVGVNVTSARRLVVMGFNWNEATDRQAYLRVYRQDALRELPPEERNVEIVKLYLVKPKHLKAFARQMLYDQLRRPHASRKEVVKTLQPSELGKMSMLSTATIDDTGHLVLTPEQPLADVPVVAAPPTAAAVVEPPPPSSFVSLPPAIATTAAAASAAASAPVGTALYPPAPSAQLPATMNQLFGGPVPSVRPPLPPPPPTRSGGQDNVTLPIRYQTTSAVWQRFLFNRAPIKGTLPGESSGRQWTLEEYLEAVSRVAQKEGDEKLEQVFTRMRWKADISTDVVVFRLRAGERAVPPPPLFPPLERPTSGTQKTKGKPGSSKSKSKSKSGSDSDVPLARSSQRPAPKRPPSPRVSPPTSPKPPRRKRALVVVDSDSDDDVPLAQVPRRVVSPKSPSPKSSPKKKQRRSRQKRRSPSPPPSPSASASVAATTAATTATTAATTATPASAAAPATAVVPLLSPRSAALTRLGKQVAHDTEMILRSRHRMSIDQFIYTKQVEKSANIRQGWDATFPAYAIEGQACKHRRTVQRTVAAAQIASAIPSTIPGASAVAPTLARAPPPPPPPAPPPYSSSSQSPFLIPSVMAPATRPVPPPAALPPPPPPVVAMPSTIASSLVPASPGFVTLPDADFPSPPVLTPLQVPASPISPISPPKQGGRGGIGMGSGFGSGARGMGSIGHTGMGRSGQSMGRTGGPGGQPMGRTGGPRGQSMGRTGGPRGQSMGRMGYAGRRAFFGRGTAWSHHPGWGRAGWGGFGWFWLGFGMGWAWAFWNPVVNNWAYLTPDSGITRDQLLQWQVDPSVVQQVFPAASPTAYVPPPASAPPPSDESPPPYSAAPAPPPPYSAAPASPPPDYAAPAAPSDKPTIDDDPFRFGGRVRHHRHSGRRGGAQHKHKAGGERTYSSDAHHRSDHVSSSSTSTRGSTSASATLYPLDGRFYCPHHYKRRTTTSTPTTAALKAQPEPRHSRRSRN